MYTSKHVGDQISAREPYGVNGYFYQIFYEIVKCDVLRVMKAYFDGNTLPKSVAHTNLVLIPKKSSIQSFSDLRLVSLSKFINKFISKMVQRRIDYLLPS